MIGLAILAIGAVLLWGAFTKRGDAIAAALKMSLPGAIKYEPPSISLGGGGSGGVSGSGSGNASAPDSGSHMGLDPNGNAIVIDKNYGDMTDAEKDAANKFANQIGNFGSTVNV